MYEKFKSKAEAARAEVHRFPDKKEALSFIAGFFQEEGVADEPGKFAVWAPCPCMNSEDQARFEAMAGVSFAVHREQAASALIGVSQVDGALAEIGTLVQDATAIDKRLVSMLPEIHLAILPTGSILADMPAWIEQTDVQKLGGYMSMITGPSRTADIERVLTIGVHGPRRLIICCVDTIGGEA